MTTSEATIIMINIFLLQIFIKYKMSYEFFYPVCASWQTQLSTAGDFLTHVTRRTLSRTGNMDASFKPWKFWIALHAVIPVSTLLAVNNASYRNNNQITATSVRVCCLGYLTRLPQPTDRIYSLKLKFVVISNYDYNNHFIESSGLFSPI